MVRYAARNSRSDRRGGPLVWMMLLVGIVVAVMIWQHNSEGIAADEDGGAFSPRDIIDRFGESYVIERKVSPGGRLGWHSTERDSFTQTPRVVRQANHYYFVCRERSTNETVVFEVPRDRFNLERVGNRISGRSVRGYRVVEDIEVPGLPSGYDFDRGER